MNENKKGYWIYSVAVIIFFVALFGFWGYLIYDLILKLSTTNITNITLIQTIITLVVTVFIGGYFSKGLEFRNNKRLNSLKIQSDIAIIIIDLAGLIIRNENREYNIQLLKNENFKVKLFFDDEAVKAINEFCDSDDKNFKHYYNTIVDCMKKCIK